MDRYRELGAAVVGVSRDSVSAQARFCEKNDLDYPMLSDRGGEVVRAYGVGFLTNGVAANRTDIGYESNSGNPAGGNSRKAFNGIIDYLAVWKRPLKEGEIRAVMRPRGVSPCTTVKWVRSSGLAKVGFARPLTIRFRSERSGET